MDYFSNTYKKARKTFLKHSKIASGAVQSYPHPLRGKLDEELAIDVTTVGTGKNAVVTVSGTHGVEGFYGSAVQCALMDKGYALLKSDVCFVHIHALNPWGFSHLRRYNENNIDLNRNFWGTPPIAHNKEYKKIEGWANPRGLSRSALSTSDKVAQSYLKKHSYDELKVALFNGQTCSPDGQLFAGNGVTWSRLCLEKIMKEIMLPFEKMFFVDLHTGLGPPGYPDLLCTYNPDSWQQKRMNDFFGTLSDLNQKNIATGQKVSNETNSAVDQWATACPNLKSLSLTLECGTVSVEKMLEALRLEQGLYYCKKHNLPIPITNVRANTGFRKLDDIKNGEGLIKKLLTDAFYVQTAQWKRDALTNTLTYFDKLINLVALI